MRAIKGLRGVNENGRVRACKGTRGVRACKGTRGVRA